MAVNPTITTHQHQQVLALAGGSCGVDECLTFARKVWAIIGRDLSMPTDMTPEGLIQWRQQFVELQRPRPWCLVEMDGEAQTHVGILLPGEYVIHASGRLGQVLKQRLSALKSVRGFWDLR